MGVMGCGDGDTGGFGGEEYEHSGGSRCLTPER